MKKSRIFLWTQAALCVLVWALLTAGAIGIYQEGRALRDAGGPTAWIFTREKVAERFGPIAPLAYGAGCLAVLGLLLGVRAEERRGPQERLERCPAVETETQRTNALRAALLALAVGLIVHGALNGSMRDVLVKAINVCTECVGLG